MEAMHYHRPTSVAEAVKLLGSHADDRVLAGGQSVLPSLRLGLLSTSGFVDLGGIPELQGIKVDGSKVVIGAMTTHAAVAASKDVQAKIEADLKKVLAMPDVKQRLNNAGLDYFIQGPEQMSATLKSDIEKFKRAIDIAGEHPEFSAWKWVDFRQVPELIVPFKRPMYQQLVLEFGHLAG